MLIGRTGLAILLTALLGLPVARAGDVADAGACPRAGTLGVSRTVEIDTTGGPGFGMEHYKAYDFLQDKEVVLTFDDGPQKFTTEAVLKALGDECVKATFFSIGKMALGYPEIIREVAKAGHTVGTHTWSHKAIAKLKTFDDGKDEIERGVSAVHRAVNGPVAPFFRFPTLVDTKDAVAYLGKRNIAIFSTDIDSVDFKPQTADHLVKSVMEKLDKRGKGILLMHDIHKTTAKALPMLLAQLKAKGYKIVHMTAKSPVTTLAEYDQAIEKDAKGLPQVGAERPMASIVKTVSGTPPASGGAASPAGVEPEGMPSESESEAAPSAPAAASLPAFPSAPAAAAPPAAAPAASPAPGKQSALDAPQSFSGSSGASSPVATVATGEKTATPAGAMSVAAVEASPVKTVTNSAPAVATREPNGAAAAAATETGALPAPAHKSITEKLKATWQYWFGE